MQSRLRRATLIAAASLLVLGTPVASAPGDPEVRFSAVGDFSSSSGAQSVFSLIGSLDNDATLALGDLSYGTTGAEEAWCDLVKARVGHGYPFELVAGNHESNGQNGNINDFSACLPNQLPGAVGTYGRQYYVDVPKGAPLVRFVMISPALPFPDSTWSYAAGSPRYAWTAAAIDGARAAEIPWVVVGMHKPCLSIGQYTCEVGADLHSLLLSKKVDLVLSGHEHLYQRTKQLGTGTGCTAVVIGGYDADCVIDADANLTKGAGTVFATVGNGGVPHRDVNTADSEVGYFAAWSGLNANPAFGVLDVSATADVLNAAFRPVPGDTFTDAFTITRGAPQPNQPPTAAFTPSCTNLTCAVNGTASFDPDGTVSSWAWTFGDGATATGSTASHTYAAAGTYPVVLTVTDNDGATDTETASVTVTDPPPVTTLASDTFSRTVASGWGAADVGGTWTNSGSATLLSVGGGTGQVRLNAGAGLWLALAGVSSSSTDLVTTLAMDKVPTGSGAYVSLTGRRIAGVGDYRAKVRYTSNGAVSLSLQRATAANVETALAVESQVPGITMAAGQQLFVRVQVTGTSPTTVRARVWKAGTTEPTTWLRTVTDSATGFQTTGGVGLYTYFSGSATNAPVTVSVDDFKAVPGP